MKTYYEPFLGGGALFWALDAEDAFDRAVVGDMNPELANAYRLFAGPAHGVERVVELLKGYPHTREFFEDMRRKLPHELGEAERAAWLIYLNRTCFNGLYRVNKMGVFNVPFGDYENPTICDEDNLREVAEALRNPRLTFMQADFEQIVQTAEAGDVVYFDPPYLPRSDTARFAEYVVDGFDMAKHERLARVFADLANRGVGVLLSNSDTPATRELYRDFQIDTVYAKRAINAKGDKRGPIPEILVSANLTPAPAAEVGLVPRHRPARQDEDPVRAVDPGGAFDLQESLDRFLERLGDDIGLVGATNDVGPKDRRLGHGHGFA
jgi:DNA adenine methylase